MNDIIFVASCRFGRGIFASRPIKCGEEILDFTGRRIGLDEALARGERQCDPLQIGPREYIDIEEPAVLVNHSCDPNAGIKNDRVLVTIADIAQGEQIFYDYSTTMDEDGWNLECQCETPACRGIVGDFKYLPPALRDRYMRLGIVLSFIADRE